MTSTYCNASTRSSRSVSSNFPREANAVDGRVFRGERELREGGEGREGESLFPFSSWSLIRIDAPAHTRTRMQPSWREKTLLRYIHLPTKRSGGASGRDGEAERERAWATLVKWFNTHTNTHTHAYKHKERERVMACRLHARTNGESGGKRE